MIDTTFSLMQAQGVAKTSAKEESQEESNDFAAILQEALQRRNNATEQVVDSLELSATEINPKAFSRENINAARKLDADGNAIEAATAAMHDDEEYRKVFHQFVGETLYGQMLKSMRETQEKPAYFHGGRAEELFQGQLDQMLVEKMTQATSMTLSDVMFRQMPKV